ncbi:MAG: chromosome partitioning protein, partial [Microbacterium sp.]
MRITSSTGAEIHVGGEIDEVFASTAEGMRARVVEAIRQLAASAGEPVTATVVEAGARWPMIVHPDGTFFEAKALAATEGDEEPSAAPTDTAAPEIIDAVPPLPASVIEGAATETPAPAEQPAEEPPSAPVAATAVVAAEPV